MRLMSSATVDNPGADRFAEGWLEDQLGKVVREYAERPERDRPRFTGDRAHTMQGAALFRLKEPREA